MGFFRIDFFIQLVRTLDDPHTSHRRPSCPAISRTREDLMVVIIIFKLPLLIDSPGRTFGVANLFRLEALERLVRQRVPVAGRHRGLGQSDSRVHVARVKVSQSILAQLVHMRPDLLLPAVVLRLLPLE